MDLRRDARCCYPGLRNVAAEGTAAWIIEDRLRVRLNIQLHKYIFDPGREGCDNY